MDGLSLAFVQPSEVTDKKFKIKLTRNVAVSQSGKKVKDMKRNESEKRRFAKSCEHPQPLECIFFVFVCEKVKKDAISSF